MQCSFMEASDTNSLTASEGLTVVVTGDWKQDEMFSGHLSVQ
jgi:hypothetical protein